MSRKPDARCQLNRLSEDRQAAVADYAARHTLTETIQWLKNPGLPVEPGAASQAADPTTHQPAPPQATSVSRSALARWLSGYRMRDQCAQNRRTLAALLDDLHSAEPPWTPDEVHQAAQAFFEALALHRQETRLWALTQRLDLSRARLELATAKHEESLRSKLKLGLDKVAEAFQHEPKAFDLYQQAAALIEPADPLDPVPQTENTP